MILTGDALKTQLSQNKFSQRVQLIIKGEAVQFKKSLLWKVVIHKEQTQCVYCGAQLVGATLTKNYPNYHLPEKPYPLVRLYAKKGSRLVLLTCDHIKPKANKGTGKLANLQLLCQECNVKKGAWR